MLTLLLALVGYVVFSNQTAVAVNYTPSIALLAPADVQQGQIVSLRYKMRVNYNFVDIRNGNRKILFTGPTVWPRPVNGGFYALQANVTSQGFRYTDDTGCTDGQPEAPYGESDLQLAIADQPGLCPNDGVCPLSNVCPGSGLACKAGHLGIKPNDLTIFPRFASGTDSQHTESILHARSQLNLNDTEISIQFDRGTTYTFSSDQPGWAGRWVPDSQGTTCTPLLPAGTYRAWVATISLTMPSGTFTYTNEYLMDAADANAANFIEVAGDRSVSGLSTEFVHCLGFYQLFVWDIQFRRDGSQTWENIDTFTVGGPDPTVNPYHGWFGIRMAEFQGKSALEVSNDGTDTYVLYGDGTFTIPTDPANLPTAMGCNTTPPSRWCIPTIRWSAATSDTPGGQTITIPATLDRPAATDVHIALQLGGTAQAGSDYTLQTPDLFIQHGKTSGNVVINVIRNLDTAKTITLLMKAPLGDHSAIAPNDACIAAMAGEPPPNPVKLGSTVLHTVRRRQGR